jgi:hypothetical protein
MAPYADVCFYLIRHEKTPRLYLKNISDLNKRKVFASLNIIFNGVNYQHSADYGYGYGYGYGYSQKEGYGQTPLKKSLLDRLLMRS